MKRTLWTVLVDRMPMAVVAASRKRDALRIIAALKEHNDLPSDRTAPEIELCPPGECAKLLRLAGELGVAESFLACVRGGMFLTGIGGLGEEFAEGVAVEQAA